MNCNICGRDGAYFGLKQVECRNKSCKNFKVPPRTGIKARVHWKVNGRCGNTRVLDKADAELRAEDGNEEYGPGTHWVEEEEQDGEEIPWTFAM